MLLPQNHLADEIVWLLSEEPRSAKALHERSKKDVTIQAIYKALRELEENRIIVKTKQEYELSQEWVQSVVERFEKQPSRFSQLESGESIIYRFTNYDHLDRVWKNAVYPLINAENQVYIYNPHLIWFSLPNNYESELSFVNQFEKRKKHAYLLIGDKTVGDITAKKKYQTDFYHISTCFPIIFPRHQFYTVVGNVVLTTQISKTAARKIDDIYSTHESEIEIRENLQPVFKEITHKLVLKVENNPRKAERFKKRIGKDFVLYESEE